MAGSVNFQIADGMAISVQGTGEGSGFRRPADGPKIGDRTHVDIGGQRIVRALEGFVICGDAHPFDVRRGANPVRLCLRALAAGERAYHIRDSHELTARYVFEGPGIIKNGS